MAEFAGYAYTRLRQHVSPVAPCIVMARQLVSTGADVGSVTISRTAGTDVYCYNIWVHQGRIRVGGGPEAKQLVGLTNRKHDSWPELHTFLIKFDFDFDCFGEIGKKRFIFENFKKTKLGNLINVVKFD